MKTDFVLIVQTQDPHQPRVCVEELVGLGEGEKSKAAMVTLFPHFQFRDEKVEVLFVCDRSGSMRGDRIVASRMAMNLFMRSMPEDSYFNIIGFGSSFVKLFPKSQVSSFLSFLSKKSN